MAWRWFDDEDLAAVKEVLDSGNLCAHGGTKVAEFERRFAAEFGSPYALAGTNAMAMMHAAVAAASVGPGDEVICDPMVTFAAISVMYHNGIPVFCDVDRYTHNIDPTKLEPLITERTKAIWVTHLWGLPADMDEINAIAHRYGLLVMEDCAHAIYAQYKGRYAGTLGDVGTFSFQQSKQMGLGDGGMALMKTEELRQAMADICHFSTVPGRLAWNYRMNELVAAVGIVQLTRARRYVQQCADNAALLSEAVGDFDWIVPQRVPDDRTSAWHIWTALFEGDKCGIPHDEFKAACQEMGVPVNFGYIGKPAYLHDIFREPRAYSRGCPVHCPHARRVVEYKEGLCPVAEEIMPRLILIGTGGSRDILKDRAEKLHAAASRFS